MNTCMKPPIKNPVPGIQRRMYFTWVVCISASVSNHIGGLFLTVQMKETYLCEHRPFCSILAPPLKLCHDLARSAREGKKAKEYIYKKHTNI